MSLVSCRRKMVLRKYLPEQLDRNKSKPKWIKSNPNGANLNSLWIHIVRLKISLLLVQLKKSCRLWMTINSKFSPCWVLDMLPKSERQSKLCKRDCFWCHKSSTNGSLANVSGCIWRTFSVQKIFKSNYLNKTRSSFWLISSGKTPWWKPTRSLLYINAARVNNCWRSFKRTTRNLKKFKRRCKITWKLREPLSPDFISYQMMNCLKFFPKPEIPMQSRPT